MRKQCWGKTKKHKSAKQKTKKNKNSQIAVKQNCLPQLGHCIWPPKMVYGLRNVGKIDFLETDITWLHHGTENPLIWVHAFKVQTGEGHNGVASTPSEQDKTGGSTVHSVACHAHPATLVCPREKLSACDRPWIQACSPLCNYFFVGIFHYNSLLFITVPHNFV